MKYKDDVKIGYQYAFNAGKLKSSNMSIDFTYKSTPVRFKNYNTWEKCHGELLIVKALDPHWDDAVVYFPKHPDKIFSLYIAYLSEIPDQVCFCDLSVLMIKGCQCGAARSEK